MKLLLSCIFIVALIGCSQEEPEETIIVDTKNKSSASVAICLGKALRGIKCDKQIDKSVGTVDIHRISITLTAE